MKIKKYDRQKGVASMKESPVSAPFGAGGGSSADANALAMRVAMLESTVVKLTNLISQKGEYLRRGGDVTDGTYWFGDVRADSYGTNSLVRIAEDSDYEKGFVSIISYDSGTVPFAGKQGDYTMIDAEPRVNYKGYVEVRVENAFTLDKAIEGMQVRFRIGYNTPSHANDFTIAQVVAYVGMPIEPAVPSPVMETPGIGDVEVESMFWTQCDVVGNIAKFNVTSDSAGENMTFGVKVVVYYTYYTQSQVTGASINAWCAGTNGDRTFCTTQEKRDAELNQYGLTIMKNETIGMEVRCDGIYRTTDGVNWVKVV